MLPSAWISDKPNIFVKHAFQDHPPFVTRPKHPAVSEAAEAAGDTMGCPFAKVFAVPVVPLIQNVVVWLEPFVADLLRKKSWKMTSALTFDFLDSMFGWSQVAGHRRFAG